MSIPPGTLVHRTNSFNENQPPYGRPYTEQQRTTSKPLNFKKAMDDFQFMFPEIDRHVIETVLRSNNGVVQSTIDQLLILQESCVSDESPKDNSYELTGLPSYESSICNGEEPPPAYSDVWEEAADTAPAIEQNNKKVLSRDESIKKQSLLIANSRWKAPLVGQLPKDFLRIEAVCSSVRNLKDNKSPLSMSPPNGFSTKDNGSSSISEDEKLAVFLQNEEFLHELRRNQEFVSSLEADHRRAVMSSGETDASDVEPVSALSATESISSGGARPRTTIPSVQDDVAFKQKLKHMGKSTKKKFSKMAKKFSRRNQGSRNQFLHTSDSTFNLLDNNEEAEYVEEGLLGIQEEDDGDNHIVAEDITNNDVSNRGQLNNTPLTSRQLPKLPPANRRQLPQVNNGNTAEQSAQPEVRTQDGNVEPIVFYSEDNEFAYKND